MENMTVDRPALSGGATASPAVDTAVQAPTLLGRADLFTKRPPKTTEHHVEGYGRIKLASLTAGQHEEIAAKHEKDGVLVANISYMSDVVAACLVGLDGERMFPSWEEGGKEVRHLDLPVVIELFKVAAGRSAMTSEAREALGKGSEPTPSVGG